jgi:hypothetical protein
MDSCVSEEPSASIFRVRRIQTAAAGSFRLYSNTYHKAVILNLVSFIKITCVGYQQKSEKCKFFLHGSERPNDPSNEHYLPVASSFLYAARECHEYGCNAEVLERHSLYEDLNKLRFPLFLLLTVWNFYCK